MKVLTPDSKFRTIRSTAGNVLRWMACDALIGAAGGALYGLMFAGLGALVFGEAVRIAAMAMYFGLCGVTAGALVGCVGPIVLGQTSGTDETVAGFDRPQVAARPTGEFRIGSLQETMNRLARQSTSMNGPSAPGHSGGSRSATHNRIS